MKKRHSTLMSFVKLSCARGTGNPAPTLNIRMEKAVNSVK